MSQHGQADSAADFGMTPETTALLPIQRHSNASAVDLQTRPTPSPDIVDGFLPRVVAAPIPPPPAPVLTGTLTREVAQGEIRGHLLVEHPGPWQQEAVRTLPHDTATAFTRLQHESGVRVHLGHLAGRPGRSTDISVLASVPDNEGLAVTRTFAGTADLAGVDWPQLFDELRDCVIPDGWEETDPALAVDQTGEELHLERLVRSLVTLDPDNVWVVSTVGQTPGVGVLALPQGLLYGSVSPRDGADLTESLWQSRVLMNRLVGRTLLSVADQVAEGTLRRHLDADAEDAVRHESSTRQQIASYTDDEGHPVQITRVISTWTVHPALVHDPVLARMMPELRGQETTRWRVVVDQSDTGMSCPDPSLSVVEVTRADSRGLGASDWDSIHTSPRPRDLPDPTVVSQVTPLRPGTALDLGCGQGRHSIWLGEHGWDVTAVDFSRAGLSQLTDEAAERGLRVRAELADLRLWTPATALFDLVLAIDIDIKEIGPHACRWVAPGGRIVLIGTSTGSGPFDHVEMAARVTGTRLRVIRAAEVERVTADGSTVTESVIVAVRRR